MFRPVRENERRIVVRACIFMAGPLLAFSYLQLSSPSLLNLFAIGLSLAWAYLSVEDVLRLSVPTRALYLICALTCVYAVLQQKPLWDYFLTIWLFEFLKAKKLMGFADFLAIISLGLSLKPHMLGPWLLIACSIPLLGVLSQRKNWSAKLPFIPYLTVGWMLASCLS